MGIYPARFEIKKLRLLFLKYIFGEKEDSMIKKFFNLQMKEPVRGDWVSQIKIDLKELDILETFEELQSMTHSMFMKKIKLQIMKKALEYLLGKRKRKGIEIEYKNLEMADYLLPINAELNIENKRRMFSIRNRMIYIKSNFNQRNQEKKCLCGDKETMEHI